MLSELPTTDMLGRSRLFGPSVDIGALERQYGD
jgi:hypothetical protein